MNKRTCTMPECDRPHRARGLCASHYNQQHAPSRHKKKPTACVVCGTVVEKASGGGRKYGATCSNECRRSLQPDRAPRTQLPPEHWARWYGQSSAWPKAGWKPCRYCSTSFPAKSNASLYCSQRCTWRWHDRANGVRIAADILAQPRECTHCGASFNHVAINRTHCSDLCRELARKARGVSLHHGWISKAERLAIYQRDDYTCWLCGDLVDMTANGKTDDWAPSLDHVVPRSKGGAHDESNLKTAHRWCNSVRSDTEVRSIFELTA